MRIAFLLLFIFVSFQSFAQKKDSLKGDKIKILNADLIKKIDGYYEGNPVLVGNVVFKQKTTNLYCDSAVFYQDKNFFIAWSKVRMQNDTVTLISDRLEYDGNTTIAQAFDNVKLQDKKQTLYADFVEYNRATEKAFAKGDVVLVNPEQTVKTERLDYNRRTGVASWDTPGVITSKDGTIRSGSAVYDSNTQENVFKQNVEIDMTDYLIYSNDARFNQRTNVARLYGDSKIISKKNRKNYIRTTEGVFYRNSGEAYLNKRSTVYQDGKELWGDKMYFNDKTGYGWAKGNVLLDEPLEKRFIKGDYGEAYRALDSAYVTGNAYAVKMFKVDSLYIHADTLMAVQKAEKKGLIRAYNKARFYKSNMSGKCDSLSFSEGDGVMKFFRDPVFWSANQQITGDTIYVYNNVELEKLDSMEVFPNAFAISKVDSLNEKEFNQVKGKKIFGLFNEDELEWVEVVGNAQALVFMDDEKEDGTVERMGINRSDCGRLEAEVASQDVDVLACRVNSTSILYPQQDLPEESWYLKNFVWRGPERLTQWRDIFINDDAAVELAYAPRVSEASTAMNSARPDALGTNNRDKNKEGNRPGDLNGRQQSAPGAGGLTPGGKGIQRGSVRELNR